MIDYLKTDDATQWMNEWFERWMPTVRAAAARFGYDEDGISQFVIRLYGGKVLRRVSTLSRMDSAETTRWIYGTVRRYSRYTDVHIIAGRMRLYSVNYDQRAAGDMGGNGDRVDHSGI